AGDHDNRSTGPLADGFDDLPATHVGHHQISQDKIEHGGVEERKRRRPILHRRRVVSEHAERIAPQLANDAVVIHDQKASWPHRVPHHSQRLISKPTASSAPRIPATSPIIRHLTVASLPGWAWNSLHQTRRTIGATARTAGNCSGQKERPRLV